MDLKLKERMKRIESRKRMDLEPDGTILLMPVSVGEGREESEMRGRAEETQNTI
jgi:hypothetical protein